MRFKTALLMCVIVSICALSCVNADAQEFSTRKITDRIYVLDNPEGEDQLVIASQKGLVVFNTMWSEITAQKYKDEISAALGRDDFYLTVDMVDRLDMFGGNAAYKETIIIGHENLRNKYEGKEQEVDAEIKRLIEMWRWKADVSRKRLETHEPGSKKELNERRWMNTCLERADDLEKGFSLVLPTVVYKDRKTLDLGDITLELIWFGRAGFDGMSIVVVPEERTAIIPGFIMHSHHLAPHPNCRYAKLDVPRWIDVFEELLEGDDPVDRVICDMSSVWPRERARTHLVYIRTLWNGVKETEAAGKSLEEIQDQLSLDNEFAFVKEMQPYKDGGDDWIRPQHVCHVKVFFLQHKNLASEMLKNEPEGSFRDALDRISRMRDGGDLYFDEASMNFLGYELVNLSRLADAVAVLKLNVELFPQSANAHDSLAEAYMKSGDTEKAIEYYKKSLELNPDNENAGEMLKKLSSANRN